MADNARSAEVDPRLIGRWKLDQPGLDIYWQIRADGVYRYFGSNARPFEHWGTMQASGGKWSTQWAGGTDGGSYTTGDDTWQSSGKAGVGNWRRVWKPGDGGSSGQCPLIDVAEVEQFLASAVRVRGDGSRCNLEVIGVGWRDGVSISITDNRVEYFWNSRKHAVTEGRPIVDVPGLAVAAYIDGDSLHILKGTRLAVIEAGMYPGYPTLPDAVSNEALIRLGQSVVPRF